MTRESILVTGAAGFIGFHVAQRLLESGLRVVAIDDLNDYYDPALKRARLAQLQTFPDFTFMRWDICDKTNLKAMVHAHKVKKVIHLAAQAGVRMSVTEPQKYQHSNVSGTFSVLEACRDSGVNHLIYASSSSVYGERTFQEGGFRESDDCTNPQSFYAATKLSNEVTAASYYNIHGVQSTGLRFFTVYGPWGRPDMAYWSFAERMKNNEPIDVYNHGKMERDFTYIDDIVDGILLCLAAGPNGHQVVNLGRGKPEVLGDMISCLEMRLRPELWEDKMTLADCVAKFPSDRPRPMPNAAPVQTGYRRNYVGMQPGDVRVTYANIDKARSHFGYDPKVSIYTGLNKFLDWKETWDARDQSPAHSGGVR